MLTTNDIDDLSAELVLSHFCLFGINQDIPTTLDPDCVSKSRGKFDEDDLLIWQETGVEIVSFSLNDTGNRLRSGQV